MKTFFIFILLTTVSSWAAVGTTQISVPQRTLKALYGELESIIGDSKIETESLRLKDYNLIVSSATYWAGSTQAENMWNSLAADRLKELNVVVVYDAPKQDITKIRAKSADSLVYEFFDQNRRFYYWFPNKTLMDAVLIGPKGDILFEGLLNSQEAVEKIKALVKKKDA